MSIRIIWTNFHGRECIATFSDETKADNWSRYLADNGRTWRAEAVDGAAKA